MRWGIGALVASCASGVIGALVWVQVAEPSRWTVVEGHLQMGQQAVATTFGVSVSFAFIGLLGGLVLGCGLGASAPRVEWWLVILAVIGGAMAMLVAWQAGVWWGPPDPATVTGLADGDTVAERLSIDLPAAFMAWPAAAVAGLLPGVWFNRSARADASARDLGHHGAGQRDHIVG